MREEGDFDYNFGSFGTGRGFDVRRDFSRSAMGSKRNVVDIIGNVIAARNNAIAEVIRAFLPALDDLSRAEKHGDLVDSPFLAVVTKLRNAGDKFGLKSFAAKGDKFDPELHNALVQTPSTDVTETVIADVVEPGFMLGERLLRPAMVAVFIPTES
jgi:molecular chaperone GrpE